MLLEQHLLQLFGNLPYLPKTEIAKHLDGFDLLKATLVSENWDKAIESQKNDFVRNRRKSSFFYLISETDRVEMRIHERYGGAGLVIQFPVESVLESSTEIDEYGDRVICHSENFEQFENRILETFNRIRSLFVVYTDIIRVNLDLGFDLEFLKKLRLEKLNSFELSGDSKNCQIDGKELTDLMNTWEIEDSVRIRVETIGKFEGNLRMLRGDYCEFTDSRWITSDMFINKFVGKGGIFKRCLLTSKDFNAYFKKWRYTSEYSFVLECHMEHELDVKTVFKDLKAKKWNPARRARTYRLSQDTFIDLTDGMDIYGNGKLATIHISADKKVIKFFNWSDRFPLQQHKKYFTSIIDLLKPKLDQFVRSPRALERMAERVENYEAKLQTVIEQIARENQ